MEELRVDEMWRKKTGRKAVKNCFQWVMQATERPSERAVEQKPAKNALRSAEMAFIARSGSYHWFFALLDDISAVAFYFFYYIRNISIHPVASGDGCCGLCTTKWQAKSERVVEKERER